MPDTPAATQQPVSAPAGAACLKCRYALTGLAAGPCPECGTHFDPARPDSMGPRKHPVLHWLAGFAPPWSAIVAMLACLLLVLLVASPPDHNVDDFWAVVIFFNIPFTLLALLVVPLVLQLLSRAILQAMGVPRPRRQWRWCIPVVGVIAFYTLHTHGTVFWVRWHFAKGGFAALATTPTSAWKPQRIGTFNIESVTVDPDGTARCNLGFPDCYSDGAARLDFGPTATDWGVCKEDLGGGWILKWDPT